MTLAIVDDDPSVRKSLARLLRYLGHEVYVFASAEEFEAQKITVDCAIVDVRMPGASGLELRDRLRNRPVPVPVVLISGNADKRLPPSDTSVLAKPFDDTALIAAIDKAVTPRDGDGF